MRELQILYLIFASILVALFALQMIRGGKYQYLVEDLDPGEFPLRNLYCAGFAWSEISVLSLKGKNREKMVGQAKLLYDSRFAEYYSNVVWAQMLSFVHLSLTVGFLLAGAFDAVLMLLIGVAMAVVFGYYFLNHMNDILKNRESACVAELPEIVSTMALLINAGMMLRQAWNQIANSKEGVAYDLMRQSCTDMDNGMAEVDAIHKFGRMTNSAEVRKFTSALAQSIERGGAELKDFLGRQSVEIWTLKKQTMLQKGEAASSKLLAPTAMLFVAIIIAVFSGALGMLL